MKKLNTSAQVIRTVKSMPNNEEFSFQPALGFLVNIKREDDTLLVECTNHYLYERGLEVRILTKDIDTQLIKAIETAYAN